MSRVKRPRTDLVPAGLGRGRQSGGGCRAGAACGGGGRLASEVFSASGYTSSAAVCGTRPTPLPASARGCSGQAASGFSGEAYPALRVDAPERRVYERGSLGGFRSFDIEQALSEFDQDVYAQSSQASTASRIRTITSILQHWGFDYPPLDAERVRVLAAVCKKGKMRSAAQLLSTAKVHAERMNCHLSPATLQALRDAKRSCERGMGPPKRAEGLPLEELHRLPDADEPFVPGGPCAPKRALICGVWWLAREMELSTARASLLSFRLCEERLVAAWCLPVSKTDQQALGVSRAHGCTCLAPRLSQVCPAHAAWCQRAALRVWWPGRHSEAGIPERSLPLFPDSAGNPCQKDAVVATIRVAAQLLGLPLVSSDGLQIWTGHSLRVGGAQSLTRLQLDSWVVQLLGRWGSDAVLQYIRDAPLAWSHLWAQQAAGVHVSPPQPAPGLGGAPNRQIAALQKQLNAMRGDTTAARAPAQGPSLDDVRRLLDPVEERLSILESSVALVSKLPETVEALRVELTASGTRPSLTSCPPSSSAGSLDQLPDELLDDTAVVRNTSSGILHAAFLPQDAAVATIGLTHCTWVFRLGDNAERVDRLPSFYKSFCERCFPSLRGSRKARLLARAGSGAQVGASAASAARASSARPGVD